METKLKVMQAALEGKAIEISEDGGYSWNSCLNPTWNWEKCQYRVKPLQVRPYTLEEFKMAVKTHGLIFKKSDAELYYVIANFDEEGIAFVECGEDTIGNYYYPHFSDDYLWADDETPMGIVEAYV